jgi:hypothetical protein
MIAPSQNNPDKACKFSAMLGTPVAVNSVYACHISLQGFQREHHETVSFAHNSDG